MGYFSRWRSVAVLQLAEFLLCYFAKKEAEELLAELKNAGVNFAYLGKKVSKDAQLAGFRYEGNGSRNIY